MAGRIVTATNLDSVRIEVLGGGAVTIPARLILAVDAVLRKCLLEEISLDVDMREDDDTQQTGWQAELDGGGGPYGEMMPTPWQAILSLAEALP